MKGFESHQSFSHVYVGDAFQFINHISHRGEKYNRSEWCSGRALALAFKTICFFYVDLNATFNHLRRRVKKTNSGEARTHDLWF